MDAPSLPTRSPLAEQQLGLLTLHPTAIYPSNRGRDQEFYVLDAKRLPVWCKSDSQHRPIRATEWICTQLAEALGIRTAGYQRVVYEGNSYFGSSHVESASQTFDVVNFLRSQDRHIYGGTTLKRGLYLSGIVSLDIFINNPDRHVRNFILSDDGSYRRLCAIDFADADLAALTTGRFPIAASSTVELGRSVRAIHGGFMEGALDMLDRIEGISPDVFRRIVASVPDEWLYTDLRDRLNDAWGSSGFLERLASLRAGLISGTLV